MHNKYKKQILSLMVLIVFSVQASACGKVLSDSTGYEPDLETEYLVTQYADASGVQGVCYTIENNDWFIIIDGGWSANEEALRNVIADHGNKVDAWIISHPHQDHAGAFNTIMSNPGDITVTQIYDNGFDYDFIESVGEPYDDISVMETYHAITADMDNVTHFVRNEEYNICGLNFRILNAYDDVVLSTVGSEGDYQNNASLLFMVESANSSMLFTSDIKYDMDEYLTATYGDSIACDYVQVGHHGNWSFSEAFYDMTGASVYFFDATASLTESADFPASSLKSYFLDQGVTVFDLESAPNTVTLK